MSIKSYVLKSALKQESFTVFSSPHSGKSYDCTFEGGVQLELDELRSSEDAFVDDLFSEVEMYGSQLLSAIAPRAFVDLNRSSDELDPALILNIKAGRESGRVKFGLGVIPRVVAKGQPIRDGKITLEEVNRRLNSYYFPYHKKLNNILQDTKTNFGQVLLIDCHSMPNDAVNRFERFKNRSPDIVLGDCFGKSCAYEIFEHVENAFKDRGFKVVRNLPFSGGFITMHYGRPNLNQHAVQIEINRSLYMDEARIEKNKNFYEIKQKISAIANDLIQIGYCGDLLAAE